MNVANSASSEASTKWYEKFGIVNCVIFCVSVFFLTVYWYVTEYHQAEAKHALLTFLAKEAGMAGLIALFLNLSIEFVNRSRHSAHQFTLLAKLDTKHEETSKKLLADVNKQLFRTVYERNIDEHVFTQVEEHLLRAKFMRRNFNASFRLKRFIDPASGTQTDLVKVECCNDFSIENLTDKPITIAVAKGLVDVTPQYREHCKFISVKVGEEVLGDAQLAPYVREEEGRNFIVLNVDRTIAPGDSMDIRIQYEKLAPVDYVEVLITTVPMDDLTIEVHDPAEHFTIDSVSSHPESELLKTPKEQHYHRRWNIGHAILPGQGMTMLWHPRHQIRGQKLENAVETESPTC